MLVTDILDNPFQNITPDGIDKSFTRLDGSLLGYCGRHPQKDGVNDFK